MLFREDAQDFMVTWIKALTSERTGLELVCKPEEIQLLITGSNIARIEETLVWWTLEIMIPGNLEETSQVCSFFFYMGGAPSATEHSGWLPADSFQLDHTFPEMQHPKQDTILKMSHQK